MTMRAIAIAAAIVSAATPAMVTAQSPRAGLATTLRSLDAAFICPQFLPSDEARRLEISAFARALAAKGVSFAQANAIRANFLTRHNCDGSLAANADAAQSASASLQPVAVADMGGSK